MRIRRVLIAAMVLGLCLSACGDDGGSGTTANNGEQDTGNNGTDTGSDSEGDVGVDGPGEDGGGSVVEQNVGPAGGTITSADGRLVMTIPADALTENVDISIAPSDRADAFHDGLGYSFEPDGLLFVHEVSVELTHDLALEDPTDARFVKLLDDGTMIDEPVTDASTNSITAAIDGFSNHGLVARSDPDANPPNPVMQGDGMTVHVFVRTANAQVEFAMNNSLMPPADGDFTGRLHAGRTTQLDSINRPYYVHTLSGPAKMVWYRYPAPSPSVSRVAYFGNPNTPVHPSTGGGGGTRDACPLSVEVAGTIIAAGGDVPLNSTALVRSDTSNCVPAGATMVETRWFEVSAGGGVDELGNPIPPGRIAVSTPNHIRHRFTQADGSLEIWVGYSLMLEAETWADGSLVDTTGVALSTIAPAFETQLRPDINGRISNRERFSIIVQRADNSEPISTNHAGDYATIELELWSTMEVPMVGSRHPTTVYGSYTETSPSDSVLFDQLQTPLPIGYYFARARVLDGNGDVVSVPPPWAILITPQ